MTAVYRVPSFDAPIVRDVDVLVVGGGPAGVGAAISAAQAVLSAWAKMAP